MIPIKTITKIRYGPDYGRPDKDFKSFSNSNFFLNHHRCFNKKKKRSKQLIWRKSILYSLLISTLVNTVLILFIPKLVVWLIIIYKNIYGFKYFHIILIIFTQLYGWKYSYLILIICNNYLVSSDYSYLIIGIYTQLYGFKYSYLILIIFRLICQTHR